MRRLTLILSDLYLPAESSDHSAPYVLPDLDWLLRFASRHDPVSDWRTWLASEFGAEAFALRPPAQVAAARLFARLDRAADLATRAWFATPVHLAPRIDHVRLADRGLISLSSDERVQLATDFAHHFAPDYELYDAGPRGFLLIGPRAMDARTVDPARLLDADVGDSIPRGQDSGELRRLTAEIEMWLHRAPVNAARAAAGRQHVSTLWLWGGGVAPETTAAPAPPPGFGLPTMHGDDPWLGALAAHLGAHTGAVPLAFGRISSALPAVVELTPMSAEPKVPLFQFAQDWFAPVRAALSTGALDSFDLLANDVHFRVGARPAWRIWRRRESWLAVLRRRGTVTKA